MPDQRLTFRGARRMSEPVISRQLIAQQARTAAVVQGPAARNPYDPVTSPGAHAEWAACFDAALKSDVLEGSEV